MYPGYTNCCRPYIHSVAPWSLLMVLPWRCVPWIQKLLLILDTLCCPLVCPLYSPYGITLVMCTLGKQFVVDPRLTLLSPGFFLWYHLVVVYPGYANNCRYLIHFVVSWSLLVVTMEMCTPDTQNVVDPRNTSLPPGLSLWFYL